MEEAKAGKLRTLRNRNSSGLERQLRGPGLRMEKDGNFWVKKVITESKWHVIVIRVWIGKVVHGTAESLAGIRKVAGHKRVIPIVVHL